MSDGSFDYLYIKSANKLPSFIEDLKRMAAALTEAGAYDAALETEKVVAFIEHSERQIEARRSRLKAVWRAMERWKNADWGRERFEEAVQNYRGEPVEQELAP